MPDRSLDLGRGRTLQHVHDPVLTLMFVPGSALALMQSHNLGRGPGQDQDRNLRGQRPPSPVILMQK
ncbi:hypothetical protein AAHC03_010000 [Spirometra sp. Aus1]